jgi:hypothetical protein
MRSILAVLAVFASLGAQAQAIGYEGARHLLDRAGFGASDADVREYAALDRAQAVERLLDGARRDAATPPPAFVNAPIVPRREILK